MSSNWIIAKDDFYGPPPAYSMASNYENPPSYSPSIYVVPYQTNEYQPRISPHAKVILSKNFTQYLLATGLIHMIIGLTAIVSDIILTIMNESYSFTGLWTGASCIVLGIDLILFMNSPEKRTCSLKRLQFIHMAMCLISTIAIILASINLASDSCYKIFLGSDRCQHSTYLIKIILVLSFSFTFVQISITMLMTFVHIRKSRLIVTTNDVLPSETIG